MYMDKCNITLDGKEDRNSAKNKENRRLTMNIKKYISNQCDFLKNVIDMRRTL